MVFRSAAISLSILSPSFAQTDRSVRLEYERAPGAETCPDTPAVRDAVAGLLGYDPFFAQAQRMIRARVARSARGFDAAVDLHEADGAWRGVRRLQSTRSDCAQVAAALVLALAIAIDPMMSDRPSQPNASAPRGPPELLVIDPPPPTAPASPTAGASMALVVFSVHGALGSAPAPAPGFELLAGLRGRRFSANFAGRLDLPAFDDAQGGRISGWVALGSVISCLHHRVLAACAVLGGGVRRLQGHDLDDARQATRPMAVAGARAALQIPLREGVAAYLHVDALGEIIETAVLVGGREAWDTPPVSAAAGVGIAALFP